MSMPKYLTPQYSWNIIESGIKNHKTKHKYLILLYNLFFDYYNYF